MQKILDILVDYRGAATGEFKPLDYADWHAFAGAEQGSLICSGMKYVFILSPDGALTAIDEEGDETVIEIRA